MFVKRTSLPEKGNKFYNTKSAGGWSTCIVGKPTKDGLNVLSNCVGWACSRYNEIVGEMKYPSLNCNAENFIERAKKTYNLEVVDYPVLGGIMVFQAGSTLSGDDGAGHVMVVEDFYDKGTILTSESAYNGKAFFTAKRNNNNGRWGMGSKYKFRGCIVNPVVGKITYDDLHPTPKPEPEPTPEPTPTPIPTPTPSTDIKLGDTVIVNGVGRSSSDGSGAKTREFKDHEMKVIMISGNTKRPNRYALNQYNKGKINDASAVTGWFREQDIKKK